MVTRSTSYRLRAGSPSPQKGDCASLSEPVPTTLGFVIQTFKAEKTFTDTCDDKEQILCSNDMTGLGGNFVSASYTAQKFLDPDTGEIVFQASESPREEIIEEDDVPGVSLL
jgi:hypothetical protein